MPQHVIVECFPPMMGISHLQFNCHQKLQGSLKNYCNMSQ